MKIGTVAKAIVGAVSAGAAAAVPLITDGHVSLADAIAIAGAVAATFGIVFAVPNAPSSTV